MTLSIAQRLELFAAALAVVLLPVVGVFITHHAAITAWDESVLLAIPRAHGWVSQGSALLAALFSTIGSIVVLIVVGVVIWRKRSGSTALHYTLMLAVPLIYLMGVKHLVARPRPALDVTVSHLVPNDYSFPSGHTAAVTVMMVTLMIATATARKGLRWTIRILGTLLMLITAFSRLVLAVHFPTDVLASLIVCPLFVIAIDILWKRFVSTPPRAQ